MIIWALLVVTVLRSWRQQRHAPRFAIGSLLLFWLFSTKPIVDQLAKPLELAYPAFNNNSAQPQLAHIVVLGCNHQDSSFLPLSSRPEPCSLARLSEAIHLWQQQPQAMLHVSGHIANRKQSHTEFARQYAIAMGVAPAKIVSHSEASNTRAEVQSLIKAINQQPTAVVTSAMHMPRTCNWFSYYGGQVIAAPTEFYVRRYTAEIGWQGWLPSVQSLHTLNYVFYEYMALLQQYVQQNMQQTAIESTTNQSSVHHYGCVQP